MIKGLDNGYLYTKDNEKRIFKSAYTRVDRIMADITIDGVDYAVGTGTMSVEVDKTDHEINKVCTLRNLQMTGSGEYYLVVGLPISQYKLQKEKFIKMVYGYNDCDVYSKGEKFNFRIQDVDVFPQGAAALLATGASSGEYIVFDIGGLTIDIAWMEINNGVPILQKCDTWYKGMQKLYSDVIHAVNNQYNLTLEPQYAEKILVNGLTLDGERQDISFLDCIKQRYLEPIMTEFQLNYPAKTTPILLTGGGGSILQDAFKTRYKSVQTIQNSQYANAIGYYVYGMRKWRRYAQQLNNTVRR